MTKEQFEKEYLENFSKRVYLKDENVEIMDILEKIRAEYCERDENKFYKRFKDKWQLIEITPKDALKNLKLRDGQLVKYWLRMMADSGLKELFLIFCVENNYNGSKNLNFNTKDEEKEFFKILNNFFIYKCDTSGGLLFSS